MKFDLSKEMFKNLQKIKKMSSRKQKKEVYNNVPNEEPTIEKEYLNNVPNEELTIEKEYLNNIPEGIHIVDEVSKSFEANFNHNIKGYEEARLQSKKYNDFYLEISSNLIDSINEHIELMYGNIFLELLFLRVNPNEKLNLTQNININLHLNNIFYDKYSGSVIFEVIAKAKFKQLYKDEPFVRSNVNLLRNLNAVLLEKIKNLKLIESKTKLEYEFLENTEAPLKYIDKEKNKHIFYSRDVNLNYRLYLANNQNSLAYYE